MSEATRAVLQVGPDPEMRGGMPASIKSLLASSLADRYRLEMLVVYRSTRPLARFGTFCLALARLIAWSARGRGRIVHVHATVRGSAYRKSVCVLLAKGMRRRVVLQVHSGPGDIAAFRASRGPFSLALFRAAFDRADIVVAVSRASAGALRAAGVARQVEVVTNAPPPLPELDREADEADDAVAAYLGGFANPAKGGDILLEALGRLPAGTPLRVTLAGPGEPPEALAGQRFDWAGWLGPEARDRLLRAAEIFVIPSRSEGLPMALLEAMAYGMAVIATDVGGIGDALRGGRDGVLVAPEEPSELAAALRLLAEDPDRRRRLGRAARARVEELRTVDVPGRFAELYARLA